MTHPSKVKGNGFERELVNQAKDSGLDAKRAWASNGQSLGMHEEVDLLVEGYKIQAKRRKSIAKFLQPTDEVDLVVAREDGATGIAIMTWWEWLNLIKENRTLKERIARLESGRLANRADQEVKQSSKAESDSRDHQDRSGS